MRKLWLALLMIAFLFPVSGNAGEPRFWGFDWSAFDSDLIPSADNTYDLGATETEWKDLFIDGVGYIDTLDTSVAAAGVTLTGTTLAADGTDAHINISITPKGTGEVNLTKVDIDAGAIDGTTIGGATPAAIAGTTIAGTGVMTVSPDGTNEVMQVNDGSVDLTDGAAGTTGTATVDSSGNLSYNKNIAAVDLDGILGSNTPAAISGTTISGTGVMTVSPDGTNEVVQVNDGTIDLTDGNAGTAGTATIDSSGNVSYNKNFAATDLDGIIGSNTPAAITGTNITANTSILTDAAGDADIGTEAIYFRKGYFGTGFSLEGSTDNDFQLTLAVVDPTTPDKTITFPDETGTVLTTVSLASALTSVGTIGSLVATTADINAGTVDATLGGTTPAAATVTTLVSKPDGTNNVLTTTDGTITVADGNAGTVGTMTVASTGSISFDKDFAATDLDGIIGSNTAAAITGTTLTSTGNTTLGDAAADTLTVNATLAADMDMGGYYSLQSQSIAELHATDESYYLDGVDDDGVQILASSSPIDSYPFTLISVCTPDDGAGAGVVLGFARSISGTIHYDIGITSDGYPTLSARNTTEYNLSSAVDIRGKSTVIVGVFEDATSRKLYVNGEYIDESTDSVSMSTSIDQAAIGYRADSSPSNYFKGSSGKNTIFNLALDNSDSVYKAIINGGEVPYKYVGASQTEIVINGGFETPGGGGADIWSTWEETASDGALANDTITVHSGTDAAKITAGASIDTLLSNPSYSIIPGKRYRVSFWTYGDGTYAGRYRIRDVDNGTDYQAIATTGVTAAAWTKVESEITVNAGNTTLVVYAYCSSQVGAITYFDDFSLTQIGCVLDLNPSGISPTTWYDSSGNGLDGTVSGALAVNMPVVKSILGEVGSPGVLNLLTAETAVVVTDELGRINFGAPLEAGGTDAILYGAGIWAVAEDTFAAGVNSTSLILATGASEAAVEKARVSSGGQFHVLGPVTQKYVITTDNTNGAATHTIAELLGGLIRRGTGNEITSGVVDVTDTAANIVAGIAGCAVGSGFEFSISNEDTTDVIQLDGGTDVTIVPTDPSTAIPALSTGRFLLVVTDASASEAVSVHALGFTTH